MTPQIWYINKLFLTYIIMLIIISVLVVLRWIELAASNTIKGPNKILNTKPMTQIRLDDISVPLLINILEWALRPSLHPLAKHPNPIQNNKRRINQVNFKIGP